MSTYYLSVIAYYSISRIIYKFTLQNIHEILINFVCLSVVLESNNFPFSYQGPKFYNTLNTDTVNSSSRFSFKKKHLIKAFICNNY